MRGKKESNEKKRLIEVHYYNVVVYVEVQSEEEYLIPYLKGIVTGTGQVTLKTILNWCRYHNLRARTKFRIRWDFPIRANFMNLVSYCRVLWEIERERE